MREAYCNELEKGNKKSKVFITISNVPANRKIMKSIRFRLICDVNVYVLCTRL